MTDDYDKAMMAHAAHRGPVHVRSQGMWAAATLVGWHPADTTRGPNARIIWPCCAAARARLPRPRAGVVSSVLHSASEVPDMALTAAERSRRYRARRAAAEGRELGKPGRPRTAQHGDPACYNAGCRHPICKAAHNARVARYRAGRSGLAPRARGGAA